MDNRTEVCRSIKLTDSVNVQKLDVVDQLRLMASHFGNDDVAELEANEKLSAERLKKVAALSKFIDEAVSRFEEKGCNSVTVQIGSELLPYLNEVISDRRGKGRFYNFEVFDRNISLDVKYFTVVRISKRIRR